MRFTSFTSFTEQIVLAGGEPLYSTLQIQIHFIVPFFKFSMPNGYFSGSLFYFFLICKRKKIIFETEKSFYSN